MTRMRIDSRLGCLALLLLGIACAVPGAAAASEKTYTIDLSPDSSPAGPARAFQATIKNTASGPQTLGSVNLTAPEPFVVISATANRGTTSVAGDVVQLRNLNLSPGSTVVATIIADDTAVTGTWDWASAAKQANNFAGTGNDFILDPSVLRPSDLDTEVTPNTPTRGQGGSSVDCPEEAAGTETTRCRLKITHRAPVPTEGLSLAAAGASFYTASLEVVANPAMGGNAGTLTLELPSSPGVDCPTLTERSPVTGRATGPANRRKTVTFTLDGLPGLGTDVPPGLCYASPTPFVTTGPGVPFLVGSDLFLVGTLPDCDTGSGVSLAGITPCVVSRVNQGGTWVITADIPSTVPDPYSRG